MSVISDISTYAVGAATVGSAIFVGIQCRILKRDYFNKNDRASKEKAIELSKFYCNEILPKVSYFVNIFREVGIQEIIENFNWNKIIEFDNDELEKLVGKDKINEINKKIKNVDISLLIRARRLIHEISFDQFCDDLATESTSNLKKNEVAATSQESCRQKHKGGDDLYGKMKFSYYENKYRNELYHLMTETMNLLEYFSMNFINEIADEEVVYQSLHQSFIGCVRPFYYWISQQNQSGKDKYYTNIIMLYNKWENRYKNNCEKEINMKRKLTHINEPLKK